MSQHPRWAAARPDPDSWRASPDRPRSEAVAEQDEAAGGRQHRLVRLPNGGLATGSIALKNLGGRRIYAYLRYMNAGRTTAVYVGEAPGETRVERLNAAWRLVHARGVNHPE